MDNFDKKSLLKNKIDFYGIKETTIQELLTIILGKGVFSESAHSKSEKIISRIGGVENFTKEYLEKLDTLSPTDKHLLRALIEFGRRIKSEAVEHLEVIYTNADIVKLFKPLIAHLPQEELWVVCMTSANRVIEKFMISKGSELGAIFDIKLLMRRILDNLSAYIVLVHNHPNGEVLPSEEDIDSTIKIKKAVEYFDIKLLDHVILSRDKSYSFTEHKVLDKINNSGI